MPVYVFYVKQASLALKYAKLYTQQRKKPKNTRLGGDVVVAESSSKFKAYFFKFFLKIIKK